MKKIFTLVSLFSINLITAQSVMLWDGEGTKNVYFHYYDGTLDSMHANPYKGGIDTSNTVVRYVRDNSMSYDNIQLFTMGKFNDIIPYASTSGPKMTLKVWSNMPVGSRVDIQLGISTSTLYPQSIHSEYSATTTVTRAWENLTFNFLYKDPASYNAGGDIDKVVLMFRPNGMTADTVYFDELMGPNTVTVGLAERSKYSSFAVAQNNPNPAMNQTSIKIDMDVAQPVSVVLYDMLGKQVKAILDKDLQAGIHHIQVDTHNLPSGIYFYTVKAGNEVQSMKMTVSK
jgi:hypothetical protein